jgi:protein SCO1
MSRAFPIRATALGSSAGLAGGAQTNANFARVKRAWVTLLCSLTVAVALQTGVVSAHPERLTGLVLSVLDRTREIVIRSDASGKKPSQTTLFLLPQNFTPTSVHTGDRIVALVDTDAPGKPQLDAVRVIPATQPKSIIRRVVPLLVGDQMPDTKFIDQRGHQFSFADFHGQSIVLSFIYTRCKDQFECPLISSHFGELQTLFAGKPYHLVEVTLDPNYDRPAVLANYGRRYAADASRWSFGTGDPNTVLDFAARFGIDPFADPRVGLIHTSRTVLIDPNGKIIDFIDATGWKPADIAMRLQPVKAIDPSSFLGRVNFWLSKATVAICGNGATGWNGLQDLAIVLAILGSVTYLMFRVARFIVTH